MKWKWEFDGDDLVAKQTELACNKTFNTVYFGVLNALFRFLLPTICLVVFNVLIFREVSFFSYISWHVFRIVRPVVLGGAPRFWQIS